MIKSLVALGIYTAKGATGVTARYIESRIGRPSLINETSRFTFKDMIDTQMMTSSFFLLL